MCGIVGFLGLRANVTIDRHQLLAITNLLSHRGPNDCGVALFNDYSEPFQSEREDDENVHVGSVGLGHRRLSIIDLSERGRQPMGTTDGSVWMVYNGEVYNYVELRNELEQMGYTFCSTSDSEVVLKSYCAWGTDCFRRFNGMWALAIYDRKKRIVVLSRDRFGKKPLYYYKGKGFIIFASEIKALLKHPDVPKEMNMRKIADYAGRHYRYVDNDSDSFFADIEQIPKSSYVVFSEDGGERSSSYWSLKQGKIIGEDGNIDELKDELRRLLNDAVRLRLRSDVPVACMLSGGLDSGSIACLAAESNTHLITFSGVTGTGYYDESEYIKEVVRHTGVDSRMIYPQPASLFPTLREMLCYHDEPVCTVTWYSNYIITSEIAKYGIPVVLTGHGGDELLAGYWDHYHYHFSDIRLNGTDDTEEVTHWYENHRRSMSEYENEKTYIQKLHQDPSVEVEKYSRYVSSLAHGILSQIKTPRFDVPFQGDLARRLYLELFFETIPPSLRAEDRNMMTFSIENRLPFLDYRLVEFCFRLGNKWKIQQGIGKWLLREAMKEVLPEPVRLRKDKAGFNAPADEWFRNENRKELEALIEKKSFVNREIYDQEKVKELFVEHLHGRNHYMFFWQYINLNLWYEIFLK